MSRTRPSVFSIPSGVSFVDALARGLLARWPEEPLQLSRATLLLPTRRACRSLAEAFLRASGGRPLLLPRLLPLGDLDAEELLFSAGEGALVAGGGFALPPVMPALKRQLLLARLILEKSRHEAAAAGPDGPQALGENQAARLAAELARLLDQVETEGLSFEGLASLVPEDYARHWQTTLEFLKIVTEAWPKLQAAEGSVGPAERRRLLLEAQAAAWETAPPEDPVIVAGSTGSIPASALLIGVVARLPAGEVVLPGLDGSLDEETWAAVREDPSHPQHGLALLLARLEVPPEAVEVWPGTQTEAVASHRADFVNWALRPASCTAAWRGLAEAGEGEAYAAALAGVRRVDCPGPGEEARAVALVLRGALNVPGRRAALVTPDRDLARRVAAELSRWNIEVDDSAGTPLADTPPGAFLRLTAEMMAACLAPVPLLAALKHPLAAGGLAEGGFRAKVRALELAVLRGPRPAADFAGLLEALRAGDGETALLSWLEGLAEVAAPFARALQQRGASLSEIVTAHVAFAEALAASHDISGPERLWAGEAGEAAAGFVAELIEAAGDGPPLGGERYPALLVSLMTGRVVRPRYGGHPRLAILGPLEARLQHVEVVVLGGLNEGTWPATADPGPWFSRPMRRDFGLPAPERRIGLAAHDFAQAFAAPELYLTRATRVEGTPSVPSRWLLRIEALLGVLGLKEPLFEAGRDWAGWAEALDRPARQVEVAPPEPRPPLAARPRKLSVTRVETWMRDPYGLYASHVLGLRALDPIDADPGAAERGILIHRALERYLAAHPESLPEDPVAALVGEGEAAFEAVRAKPGVWAFWWPRFLRIARWFAEAERHHRAGTQRAWAERRGELILQGPAGPFVLTATADRIDQRRDGRLGILDYKTGGVPRQKEIELGFAPQLTLEAAIAAAGGFGPEVPAAPAGELAFWRLTGGSPPGEIVTVKGDPAALAAEALRGLERLVALFDDEDTAYHALPRPDWAPRFNDYAHLARVAEWSAGGSASESGKELP
ncbi:MAG: double-strand break repair protein AddB [Rhodospirillales bacterium]|nr:double-strand break repair protein AddB [Rhodospirillales bacterium]